VKTAIEIDQEALALAAEVLGTTTKKDTVNAALREVGSAWSDCGLSRGSAKWQIAATSMSSVATRPRTASERRSSPDRHVRERLIVLADDHDYRTVASVTGQAVRLVTDI
jgi:Bacterial antitoxin of type II TA system, VapB